MKPLASSDGKRETAVIKKPVQSLAEKGKWCMGYSETQ